MSEARAVLSADTSKYVEGFDRAAESHEHFFRSERFVERSLASMTQQMLTATSATDVLSIAIEKITHTMNAGLVVGASVLVGAMIKDSIEKQAEEFSEINDSIEKAFSGGIATRLNSEESLNSALEKQISLFEQLADKQKKRDESPISRTWNNLSMALSGGGWNAEGKLIQQGINQANAENLRLQTAISDKEREQAEIIRMKSDGREREAAMLELQTKKLETLKDLDNKQLYRERPGVTEKFDAQIDDLNQKNRIKDQLFENSMYSNSAATDQQRLRANGEDTRAAREAIIKKRNADFYANSLDYGITGDQRKEKGDDIQDRANADLALLDRQTRLKQEQLELERAMADVRGDSMTQAEEKTRMQLADTQKRLAIEKDPVHWEELKKQEASLFASQDEQRKARISRNSALESSRSGGRVLDLEDPTNHTFGGNRELTIDREKFSDLRQRYRAGQTDEERLNTFNDIKRLRNQVSDPSKFAQLGGAVDSLTAIGGGGALNGSLGKNLEQERADVEKEMRDYLKTIADKTGSPLTLNMK